MHVSHVHACVQWLAVTLDTVEQGIIKATTPPSFSELNKTILNKVAPQRCILSMPY
jgi:sarcosine oxidase delta subunit